MTNIDEDPFDRLWRDNEDFMLELCDVLGISYEDSSQEDVIREIKNLKEYKERWLRSYSV